MNKILVASLLIFFGSLSQAENTSIINGQEYTCPDGYGLRVEINNGQTTYNCSAGSTALRTEESFQGEDEEFYRRLREMRAALAERRGIKRQSNSTSDFNREMDLRMQEMDAEMEAMRSQFDDLRVEHNCPTGNLFVINGVATCEESGSLVAN